MPLAMDGKILISPTIGGAISSGDLFISMGSADDSISAAALAAILKSGPLPEGWTTESR
jgi:preprotein translocase subunit SecD